LAAAVSATIALSLKRFRSGALAIGYVRSALEPVIGIAILWRLDVSNVAETVSSDRDRERPDPLQSGSRS
jgi:hypothetical protein